MIHVTLNPGFKSDRIWFIRSFVSIWNQIQSSLTLHLQQNIVSTNFHTTKRHSRHQWKTHHFETLWECKNKFSKRFIVGFLFAFYHHTYPGGKQKASNKSETLKLWGREISSKLLKHIKIQTIEFIEFFFFYNPNVSKSTLFPPKLYLMPLVSSRS